ncbi:MAG: NB-ARC domain-containing protein [Ktedonobacteraceae bacterium]
MRRVRLPIPNPLLAEERLAHRWSQQEVADHIGTTSSNVSRWERGATIPGSYFRKQLYTLFGKDAAELGLPASELTASHEGRQEHPPFFCDPIIPSPQSELYPLIGREVALQQVVTNLCTLQKTSYALIGLPGVGKTALALALAHHPQIRQYFCDGILWAGLGPTPHLGELLSRWGTVLQLDLSDLQGDTRPEDWAKYVQQQIGDRRMLIILDDAWTLADAITAHLGGNRCAYLLTTRFPQLAHTFAGEQVLHLHELTEAESLTLFQHISPRVHQEHFDGLQCLIEKVGSLPLVLTLLSRHLHIQSLSNSPRRLAQTLHSLCTNSQACFDLEEPFPPWAYLSRNLLGRSLSVRLAIDLSVHALPTSAQDALCILAIFPPKPATFSEEAVCAVGNISSETLDLLVDSGLVEFCCRDRYRIPQTIANYARLCEPDLALEARLVRFAVHLVETHQQDFCTLEQDLPLIIHAFEIAVTRDIHQPLLMNAPTLLGFLEHYHLSTIIKMLMTHV